MSTLQTGQDGFKTNLTVQQLLKVGERIVSPEIIGDTITVRRTLNFEQGATVSGINFVHIETGTLDVNTLNAVTINVIDLHASNIMTNDIATQRLRALATSDQIVFGFGNLVTLNVDTTNTRTITLPSPPVNAQIVLTEGNQTINGTITFDSTVIFNAGFALASLTLSDTSNQLTLGTGSQIVVSAPTPAATRTYTMPDVLANADFVMTEGNQTINGIKTFTSPFSLASLSLSDTSNQILLGTGQIITLNGPTPAASRVYTFPDVLANADFVMTEGNQTINGVKTFTSVFTLTSLSLTDTSNQISLGTGNLVVLNAPTPAALRIYTMPDVGASADFVMTEGNQTINGVKTFTSGFALTSLTLSDTSNQLTLGTGNTITINAPTPAASRFYTMPDVLANASFVMTEGNQTINGVKTFTSPLSFATITLTAATNQIVLGTVNTITLNGPAPAASRVYSFPDVGGAASFVMTAGAQTVAGAKTLSSALTITPTTNQFVLGTVTTVTLTAPTPAASRVYTVPDVGANAAFVMTEGNQTINGVKTFTSSPVFPGLSFATLTLTATSNQLILGTGDTITVSAPTPATSITYTMADVGLNAEFAMTEGSQTINSLWVFSQGFIVDSAGVAVFTATSNQIVFGVLGGITLNVPSPAAGRVYTMPDVGANADFVMTQGNQTINGVKTFTSAPVFPGLSFASLTLTDTTNQLTLGTGNTTTISSVAPAASRTYTIPDAGNDADIVLTRGTVLVMNYVQTVFNNTTQFAVSGTNPLLTITNGVGGVNLAVTGNTTAQTFQLPELGTNATFVMTEGNQTINGVKTFTSAPVFTGLSFSFASLTLTNTTNQLVLGTTNTTTITSPAPAASRTYTIPDAGGAASFVMTASNQTINGTKTFGSGILLPTTGGTPTALDFYEVFTDTISWVSTTYSGSQNQSVTYSRVGRSVTAQFTGFNVASSGGSGDGNINNVGDLVPARFRPLTNTEVNMTVRNAGTTQVGVMFYQTTGEIQFYRGSVSGSAVTTANFQNGAGNVGFQSFSVSWVSA